MKQLEEVTEQQVRLSQAESIEFLEKCAEVLDEEAFYYMADQDKSGLFDFE